MTSNPTSPLSPEQVEAACDVGRQMHDALHLLLNAFPEDERTAKALAARLGIDGVVARRVVRAANESADPARLLTRLPSVENLRKVQRAAVTGGVNPIITADLVAGVDAFAALVETFGPGKAALTKRLRATVGADADDED